VHARVENVSEKQRERDENSATPSSTLSPRPSVLSNMAAHAFSLRCTTSTGRFEY
jgi:hypothetical protein